MTAAVVVMIDGVIVAAHVIGNETVDADVAIDATHRQASYAIAPR